MRPSLSQLRQLVANQSLIQLSTRISEKEGHPFSGYLVGMGKKLVLLHLLENDWRLNGYTALPISEITRARVNTKQFLLRHLKKNKQSPKPLPNIGLDNLTDLLDSIEAGGFLINLHTERTHPNECYIGIQLLRNDSHVVLYEVDPAAKWGKNREYSMESVTRIDFGGAYEMALQNFAGKPSAKDMVRRRQWWSKVIYGGMPADNHNRKEKKAGHMQKNDS